LIVVDASAVLELLLRTDAGLRVSDRILSESLHAPHLMDLEVLQFLRRHTSAGILEARRANEAFADFQALRIRRHNHFHLLDRIWSLRHNLTAYDACYLALAEELGAVLLTGDAALASVNSRRTTVELI
jgi:predicted nucleic acid-binding protein